MNIRTTTVRACMVLLFALFCFSQAFVPYRIYLMTANMKEIEESLKSEARALDLIETRAYTIMTTVVRQAHYLGRHQEPVMGCSLCYTFVKDQEAEVNGTSEVDEIVNTAKNGKDMQEKLNKYFNDRKKVK